MTWKNGGLDLYFLFRSIFTLAQLEPGQPCPRFTAPCTSWSRPQRWQDALDPSILQLPRTLECFAKVEGDERMGYDLPHKNALAGKILKHCFQVVSKTISKFKPLIFKLGFSHDVHMRMYNRKFGYVHEKCSWEHIVILYTAGECISAAFVEAALIQRFKGFWDMTQCIFFFWCWSLLFMSWTHGQKPV